MLFVALQKGEGLGSGELGRPGSPTLASPPKNNKRQGKDLFRS